MITTPALFPAIVGTPYNASFTAAGGIQPYTWAVSSGALPVGIGLNQDTGFLSGTATQAGRFGFQATVTDSRGVAVSAALSILVSAPPPLIITTQTLPSATVGTPYSAALTATGGVPPYSWTISSGAVPPGIEVDQDTGLLSGSATQAALFAFEANVMDSQGSQAYASMYIRATGSILAIPVQLPLNWVNDNEGLAVTYELALPSTWIAGPPAGCTFHTPYWTGSSTFAGLQSAINDIEACRTTTAVGIALDIPPGLYSSTNGLVIPQSSPVTATSFLVLRSTQDSSLPNGQTVCAHGVQDNLATSTDIGLRNPSCDGNNLSFQLGTTITQITLNGVPQVSFPYTLANGAIISSPSVYDDALNLFTVQCTGANCIPIQTCSPVSTSSAPPPCASATIGPDHWLIEDMEARMSAGNTGSNSLVAIQRAGVETSTSHLSSHIQWRKIWPHGDWCDGCLSTGANSIANAIALGCVNCSVVDSQVSEILRPGAEGHAIGMDFGSQTKIDHNWFEGGSIGLLCGGFTSTISISGYIPCTDLQIGRNRFTWPFQWIGQMKLPSNNTHYSCSPGCQSLARKNATEFKMGVRVLIYGNIFENCDNSGGQSGVCGPQLNVRNNSGSVETSGTQNYNAVIRDVTVSGNIYRNGCEGFTSEARSNATIGDGGGVSLGMQNISISNNLWYNVSNENFGPSGCAGTNATGWSLVSALFTWQATITEDPTGRFATAVITCASSETGNCPSGPPGPGFAVTDIQVGDPVSVYGCTAVPGFDTGANALFAPPSTALGAKAMAGTTGLTVVFPNTSAPPNAIDNTGSCTISNAQGYPANMLITHNTIITDGGFNNGSLSQAAHFAPNGLLQNNIILGTGWISSTSQGNHTENLMWDALNTFTADYNVWPTRTASKYTEYCNNPNFPSLPECTGIGRTPPLTMYFPATAANVGFSCSGCSSSVPLVLSDYHGYTLLDSSPYHNAASDGTDIGVIIAAIDTAQTLSLYICATPCGSGPYPDDVPLTSTTGLTVPRGVTITPRVVAGHGREVHIQRVAPEISASEFSTPSLPDQTGRRITVK